MDEISKNNPVAKIMLSKAHMRNVLNNFQKQPSDKIILLKLFRSAEDPQKVVFGQFFEGNTVATQKFQDFKEEDKRLVLRDSMVELKAKKAVEDFGPNADAILEAINSLERVEDVEKYLNIKFPSP